MTVELTDGEARELADLLRGLELAALASHGRAGAPDVAETQGGQWADRLDDRADGDREQT